MLLRATTKMCPCQALFTVFRVQNTHALAQHTLEMTVGCTVKTTLKITAGDPTPIPSVNPTQSNSTQSHLSTQPQSNHDNKARVRADGDKRAR